MELLQATRRAFEEFGPFDDGSGHDLRESLPAASERVRIVVPSCVAVSLALVSHGVTFTVQATGAEFAASDGGQHLEGGVCVAAAQHGAGAGMRFDPTCENHWVASASVEAAPGVAATLTLPILAGGAITGTVDLYAATRQAFAGVHEQVADLFDAWAPGATSNADLGFTTRLLAQQAPVVLRREAVVEEAVRMLAARHGLAELQARVLLGHAAARARSSVAAVARAYLDIESR